MNVWFSKKQKGGGKKALLPLICFLVCLLSLNIPFAFANVLGNSDFSQPLGNGTGGNWDNTNGATTAQFGTPAYPAGFPAPPPNGQYGLRLDGNSPAFTFQTYDNVKPGDYVTFSAMAVSSVDNTKAAHQVKIEFKRVNSDGSDTLIKTVPDPASPCTPATCVNNLSAAPAGGFQPFQVAAVAPEGTGRVAFVFHRLWGPVGGAAIGSTIFAQANAEVNPAKLSVTASKTNVARGDAIGINARYNNASGNTLTGVELRVKIPHGFDYAAKTILVNGHPAGYREGSLIIPVGTIPAGATFTTNFVALVTSGIQLGKEYSMEFTIVGTSNLSEKATLKFTVHGDPVFDEGTIIGKVFNDLNQNGVQDKGEEGIPWVRLYTEQGVGIVTDEHGLYSIPNVSPGRHVVKIDGHSLPDGTKFITEEAYLVKTTPGIMNKANFAVLLPPSEIPANFQKDLKVMVTQGVDVSRPTLDVQISPDVVKLGVGVLEKEPAFTFNNNYGKFIKSGPWRFAMKWGNRYGLVTALASRLPKSPGPGSQNQDF